MGHVGKVRSRPKMEARCIAMTGGNGREADVRCSVNERQEGANSGHWQWADKGNRLADCCVRRGNLWRIVLVRYRSFKHDPRATHAGSINLLLGQVDRVQTGCRSSTNKESDEFLSALLSL